MVRGKNTSITGALLKSIAILTALTLIFVMSPVSSNKKYQAIGNAFGKNNGDEPHLLHLRLQNMNLRYDNMPNKDTIEKTIKELNSSIPVDGEIDYYNQTKEVPWSTRRIGIMNDVLFNRPDIFTVNEGLHRQVNDLKELLKMEFIGVGREDGKTKGEYQAIYYDSKKFQLLDYDTFWLSHDPFNPSKYRWAGSYRSFGCRNGQI
ncbi:unnamed protein product [Ambrosiozyma monospora]|uniref:Unnamed protein product n=1 Tax=Ambrosiozyma monospora TaxID=43982 RepID=A0ACB5T3G3_AMBMO|nr:unnamed protein product [Ambrosiozyma monospora]